MNRKPYIKEKNSNLGHSNNKSLHIFHHTTTQSQIFCNNTPMLNFRIDCFSFHYDYKVLTAASHKKRNEFPCAMILFLPPNFPDLSETEFPKYARW